MCVTIIFIQSDREVHGERAILHHLQLPLLHHPRHSVQMHPVPIRAPQPADGRHLYRLLKAQKWLDDVVRLAGN